MKNMLIYVITDSDCQDYEEFFIENKDVFLEKYMLGKAEYIKSVNYEYKYLQDASKSICSYANCFIKSNENVFSVKKGIAKFLAKQIKNNAILALKNMNDEEFITAYYDIINIIDQHNNNHICYINSKSKQIEYVNSIQSFLLEYVENIMYKNSESIKFRVIQEINVK